MGRELWESSRNLIYHLVNEGIEDRIARLAKNKDTTRLKLYEVLLTQGVKNPSPSQLEAGILQSEQNRQEFEFFALYSWKKHGLDQGRLGIKY
jgi:hypothetical protein